MAYTTIDDPSAHFHTRLYTATGNAISVTNDANAGDFQPDWIWLKSRNNATNHNVFDSSRGQTKRLYPNTTDTEDTVGTFALDSNGFSIGGSGSSGIGDINIANKTMVAWQWKANGGSTTSFSASGAQLAGTRQSNTTAGFSIITYTGDGNNNATIPHGLDSAPQWVIIKERANATNWYVGHNSTFTTGEIFLNLTNALAGAFGPFNKTAPTSTNIVLGTDGNVNGNNDTYVCYAFSEVQGYSKFGSYVGNGNADGMFVYTGFKPAWIMIKKTNNTSQWVIHDTTRQEYNMNTKFLQANQTATESTSSAADLDILSNGFKLRSSDDAQNGSGDTYIYMAFAEHPLVSSEGVPVTAR